MSIYHRLLSSATVVAASGLLVACINKEAPLDGAKLFADNCVACHGNQADGTGPAAADLAKDVPDLRRISSRNGGRFPRGTVRSAIDGRTVLAAHQSSVMPVWGEDFAAGDGDAGDRESEVDKRIDALLDYLADIQIRD